MKLPSLRSLAAVSFVASSTLSPALIQAQALPPPPAPPAEQSVVELSPFEVRPEDDSGYQAGNTTSGWGGGIYSQSGTFTVSNSTITGNTTRPLGTNIDFLGHALRTVDGSWGAASNVSVPAGSWIVPMNQKLARLVFYLLEPTTDDGAVTWNYLDNVLAAEGVTTYPILRKR